ncbi:MAG: hypothetical protein AB1611_09860 [bacterium]
MKQGLVQLTQFHAHDSTTTGIYRAIYGAPLSLLSACLALSLSLLLTSCSKVQPKVCLRDGRQYCLTTDKIQVITWDACYRRAINCMEGQCWEYAIEELYQAIALRFGDQRQVRAYGMHFREEYFPHRELGICYFHLGRIEDAVQELELSLSQTPSARAKYYLNQGRRAYLLDNHLDTAPPAIHLELGLDPDLEPGGISQEGGSLTNQVLLTNQTPFPIQGTAQDDHYVASISVNQKPVFIELAEGSIPFSVPVDLTEGENMVQVVVRDLADRQVQQNIRISLDSQGPLVIGYSIRAAWPDQNIPDRTRGASGGASQETSGGTSGGSPRRTPDGASGQIILTAVVYDRSGIASFKLDQKEAARIGLDQLCLIEQAVPLTPAVEFLSFQAQDRAGNITQGRISLIADEAEGQGPERPSVRHPAAVRLAWSGGSASSLEGEGAGLIRSLPRAPAAGEENGISFDIVQPPEENFTTHYPEIFLEGRIRTRRGIRKIELNGQKLFEPSDLQEIMEKNMEKLKRRLLEQKKDPAHYVRLLQEAVQSSNLYYLNRRIPLINEVTDLDLVVEDAGGMRGARHYRIEKIPREEVIKSEQRMILALLPFDTATADDAAAADDTAVPDMAPPSEMAAAANETVSGRGNNNHLQSFINAKSLEAFVNQGRFNLVERGKLPWVLIEKTIQLHGQTAGQSGGQPAGQSEGRIYQSDVAQKIGAMAAAEGVICGYIQRRGDGTEILARFVEVKTGLIRLYHDVFTPTESRESLETITAGLAMKFRDSFPVCSGSVVARQGKSIQVDFGSEKGIFPGMMYNIFENEQELIARANIREVGKGASEAEITGGESANRIKPGYRVRTR